METQQTETQPTTERRPRPNKAVMFALAHQLGWPIVRFNHYGQAKVWTGQKMQLMTEADLRQAITGRLERPEASGTLEAAA